MSEESGRLGAKAVSVLHRNYVSEQAIYGTILVSAVIGIGADDDTDLEVLLFTVVTVVIFWLAHVYAATFAIHARGEQPIGRSIGEAFHRESRMLIPLVLPAIALLTGVFGLVDEETAFLIALWVGTLVLAVLGYLAFMRRGSVWWARVLGGLGTAAFGVVMIGLNSLIH
ncbi:hypothetical protein [Compostimonas suwonensis]|uniref:Uncharacterized protein n=1 Tax=Compostimonas suwonensis TaxID=1048394 RepID=A0A2M9BVB0_9MICO|nr:hypothetical protein [Compostimonas suwonensis]PJJ61881.1 hypothetical protein CLV54_1668 [Compostimonas suwonensis]